MSNPVAIPNSKDNRAGEPHGHVEPSYQLADFFGQPRWPTRADERLSVESKLMYTFRLYKRVY